LPYWIKSVLLASNYLHVILPPHSQIQSRYHAFVKPLPPPKCHGNNFDVKVISPKTSSCELHFEATKSERRTSLEKMKIAFFTVCPQKSYFSTIFCLLLSFCRSREVTCASFKTPFPSFFTHTHIQNIFLRTRILYRSAVKL
jgi:hypothetical protein